MANEKSVRRMSHRIGGALTQSIPPSPARLLGFLLPWCGEGGTEEEEENRSRCNPVPCGFLRLVRTIENDVGWRATVRQVVDAE
jgi:hypothetical protein